MGRKKVTKSSSKTQRFLKCKTEAYVTDPKKYLEIISIFSTDPWTFGGSHSDVPSPYTHLRSSQLGPEKDWFVPFITKHIPEEVIMLPKSFPNVEPDTTNVKLSLEVMALRLKLPSS